MDQKLFRNLFAAIMANAHFTLKNSYKAKGKEPADSEIQKEVDKVYESYFHKYDFHSGD